MRFDQDWYTNQYIDVAESKILPIAHYLEYGLFEGRYPKEPEWFKKLFEEKSWFMQEIEIAQDRYLISFESKGKSLKENIHLKFYFEVKYMQHILKKIDLERDEQKKYIIILNILWKRINRGIQVINIKIFKKSIMIVVTNSDFDRARVFNIAQLNGYIII
jgi:hypothetical protein